MTRKKEKKEGKVTSALDEQTLGYFKRVDDVIKDDDFDDEEGRKLFIENVFTQIENNEIRLFCDQLISRTLEKLIIYFSDLQICKVLQNVEDHFCKLAMDKFGSHVLQTLICIIPKTIRSERSKVREVAQEFKDLKGAEQLFLDLCDSFKENLSELVNHIYGSHVVRAAIEVLGGVKVSDNVVRSRASRQSRERDSHSDEKKPFIKLNQVGNAFGSDTIKPMETIAVPDSFYPMLKQFTKVIIKMDLQKLVLHPISNPLLQTLLLVLHMKNQSLCMKLCKAVMSQIDMLKNKTDTRKPNTDDNHQNIKDKSDYRVPVLLSNEISSHMIEKILHVVTPDLWQEIYEMYFSPHLPQLAQHPIANFIVQHLMASAREKLHAKQIIAELLPYLEDLLAQGHVGVVVRMAETAVRFSVRQKKVLKALLQAFHCQGKDEQLSAVVLISSLTTYNIFFGTKENENKGDDESDSTSEERPTASSKLKSVNYHGAMLLKVLFDFQKPSKLVKSLLSLSLEEVLILANDPMGSHAVEAFLKSRSVPSDDKNILIQKLQGVFSKLSCEKQGSRVVETCWRQAEVKYKEVITRELADNEHQLKDNFYGKFVLKNCGVEHFKRKDKTWHEREQKVKRKRKLLEEIFEERDELPVSTKRAKPETENKFAAQLAPEMAALGFTAGGNHAHDSGEGDDRDNINTGGEPKKKKEKKKKKCGSKKSKTENSDINSLDEEDNFAEMEFINNAIKETKAVKKCQTEKRKKRQK